MKIIFLISIVAITFFSCNSSTHEKGNRRIEQDNNRERQAREAYLLSNISKTEYKKKLKSSVIGSYVGVGVGKITGSVEDAKNEAFDKALFNIAQSFQTTVSGRRTMESSYSENNGNVKTDEILTNKINTSAMAIFRDIKPAIYYDSAEHEIRVLIIMEKHKLETHILKHDNIAKDKAKYYFQNAISYYRKKDYSQALRSYYNAYYLSSQVQESTAEYYDRKFRKTYDIQIESQQRITKIIQSISIQKEKSVNEENILCKVITNLEPASVISNIPFVVDGITIFSNNKGIIKILNEKKKENINIKINFQELRINVSKDLYGFIDSDFSDMVFRNANNFIVSLKQKKIQVQFYTELFKNDNSAKFTNYSDNNISLIFTPPSLSYRQVVKIINHPNDNIEQVDPKTIIGLLKINQRKIEDRTLLLSKFEAVYVVEFNKRQKIEINNMKALGFTKREAFESLKQILINQLIELFK